MCFSSRIFAQLDALQPSQRKQMWKKSTQLIDLQAPRKVARLAVTLLVAALAGTHQAAAQEELPLDAQVVAALVLRDEQELAGIVADRYVAEAKGKATRTERLRQLSRALMQAAQLPTLYRLSHAEDLKLRSGILERAERYMADVGKIDPNVAKNQDFRVEKVLLKHHRAQVIASALPRISVPEKAATFRGKARKLFNDAIKEFQQINREQGSLVDKLERQEPPLEKVAQDKWLDRIDEEDGKWGASRLREAICKYQLAMFEDEGQGKQKLLDQLDKEFADMASRYGDYQFIAHIRYYWGLILIEKGKYEDALKRFAEGSKAATAAALPDIRHLCYHGQTKALLEMAEHEKEPATKARHYRDALRSAERSCKLAKGGDRERFIADRVEVASKWSVAKARNNEKDEAERLFGMAMQDAMALLRANSPSKSKAMKLIVSAMKAGKGAFDDQIDYHVLEAVADIARRDEEWLDAADGYRQLGSISNVPSEIRDKAAYYLAYSYYKMDRLLETAIAASWGADTASKEHRYLADCDRLAIRVLTTLAKPEDASFYKELRRRELRNSERRGIIREGNPQFEIGYGLFKEKNYSRAVIEFSRIQPGDKAYDKALFFIGECYWKINRAKRAEPIIAAAGLVQCREAFQKALDYCSRNPGETPEEKSSRKDLKGKCIFRLASIESAPSIYEHAHSRLAKARGSRIGEILEKTAKRLGQPTDGLGKIEDRSKARAAIETMRNAGRRRVITLTDNFTATYNSLRNYFPYIHFMRFQAFIRIGGDEDFANAEKEVEAIRKYPEDAQRILKQAIRDLIVMHYRELKETEARNDKPAARHHRRMCVEYLLQLIEDGGAPFSDYEFLAGLAFKDVEPPQRDHVIAALGNCIADQEDKGLEDSGLRNVIYVLAKLQADAGNKHQLALKHYGELDAYYDGIRKEKPNVYSKLSGVHRAVKRSIADCFKATGKYQDAIALYREVGQKLKPGTDDWWKIIYDLAESNALWNKAQDAFEVVDDIQKVRPSMGGPEMRRKFIVLFSELTGKTGDKELMAQMNKIVDAMQKYVDKEDSEKK